MDFGICFVFGFGYFLNPTLWTPPKEVLTYLRNGPFRGRVHDLCAQREVGLGSLSTQQVILELWKASVFSPFMPHLTH